MNIIKVLFTRDGELLLTGERKENTLYQLNFKPEIQKTQIELARISFDTAFNADLRSSINIWHQRLGHIGYHTMKKMIQQDLVIGLNVSGNIDIPSTLCSGCKFGKFTRSPLKIGRNRANRIGKLIHSDVWGPIATPSLGGARYYVTFKDDFSGYLTVYFMKKKSEVSAFLRLYAAMVLNETGNYILVLFDPTMVELNISTMKTKLSQTKLNHRLNNKFNLFFSLLSQPGSRNVESVMRQAPPTLTNKTV